MSILVFLMGIVIGFVLGGFISCLLIQRRIRWENSPKRVVEGFITDFNRYYEMVKRESDSGG